MLGRGQRAFRRGLVGDTGSEARLLGFAVWLSSCTTPCQ